MLAERLVIMAGTKRYCCIILLYCSTVYRQLLFTKYFDQWLSPITLVYVGLGVLMVSFFSLLFHWNFKNEENRQPQQVRDNTIALARLLLACLQATQARDLQLVGFHQACRQQAWSSLKQASYNLPTPKAEEPMSNKRQLNSHSDLQNSTKRRVNKSNQNDTMSPASRGRGKWGRQGSSSSVSFMSRRA